MWPPGYGRRVDDLLRAAAGGYRALRDAGLPWARAELRELGDKLPVTGGLQCGPEVGSSRLMRWRAGRRGAGRDQDQGYPS